MGKECCAPRLCVLPFQNNSRFLSSSLGPLAIQILKRCALLGLLWASSISLPAFGQLSPLEVAEEHFVKARYPEALEKFNEILKNPFAAPRDIALSQCRVGIVYSIQDKLGPSRQALEKSVAGGALPRNHSSLCHYALLQLYVLGNANLEARELLKKIGEPRFSSVYVARVYALGAEVGRRVSDNRLEVLYLQKLKNHMERHKLHSVEIKILGNKVLTLSEVRQRLGIDASDSNAEMASAAPLSSLPAESSASPRRQAQNVLPRKSPVAKPLESASPESETQPTTQASAPKGVVKNGEALTSIFEHFAKGQNAEVLKELNSLQNSGTSQPFSEIGLNLTSDKMMSRVRQITEDSAKNVRVGIVLAAGSTFTKYNYQILKGISAFANSSAVNGVNYSFHVRAVGADSGSAEDAALRLILDESVHVIMGPVSSGQTLGVLNAAALFGVPVFSLGPVPHTPELNSQFLTRMGVLGKSQARSLIEHLQGDLGFKNAGIFAPNDAYGFEMAACFSAAAKEKSFEIKSQVFFDANADIYQQPVQSSLGNQDEARSSPEYKTMILEMKKKAQAEKRKFDPSQIKLPAFVRFDALFVPDSLSRAKVISSTFAFFEAKNIRFLGDRSWGEGGGKSSLADQFLNYGRVPMLISGSFLSHLRRDLAQAEGNLDLERQAFDSLVLVRQAQYKASGANGKRMVESLREPAFQVDATSRYGAVDDRGEPAAKFKLWAYKNGKLNAELEPWPTPTPAVPGGSER